ncbi:hypothetical protein Henu6_gp8 [Acinetobacter phage Henu6]|uniref:Uncharacterized protein n=1 Tax=Acinetobacter phage Henu6 TaxID=2500136 RepID=A0A410T502_9CAUD|nr:hypothetical protein Henu6_gp8 [Acinetobacter phage Henu6]
MTNKVNSFRAETTKLTCDVPTVRNTSERWVVQFVGSPGLMFNGIEERNVHFVCPYRKFPFGWAVDPWHERLLVKELDFKRGVVIAYATSKDVEKYIEFYVDEKEYV